MTQIANLVVRVSGQVSDIQRSFDDVTRRVSGLQAGVSTASRALGSLGVGLGATALLGFTRQLIDAAGETVDLANKLGISTSAVQRLNFIAGQTGTTIEAFGKAIFALGNAVAGDDKSAAEALKQLGISFSDLKGLEPEKQFDKVVIALARITDAQERNAIATKLFGSRNAQEIAKAVAEYEKLSKIAPEVGERQVRAAEAAGDAIDRFGSLVRAAATDALGTFVLAGGEASDAIGKMGGIFNSIAAAMPGNVAGMLNYADAIREVRAAEEERAAASTSGSGKAPKVGKDINLPLASASPEVKALAERALKPLTDAQNESTKAFDAARAAADAYRTSVKNLRDELSGAALQAEVKLLEAAFKGLTAEQRANPAVMQRVGEAAERLADRGARLTAELFLTTLGVGQFSRALTNVRQGIDTMPGSVVNLTRAFQDFSAELPILTARWEDYLGAQAKFGTSIDPATLGLPVPDPEVGRSIEEIGRTLTDVSNLLGDVGSNFDNLFGAILSGAADAVDGIGRLVTATSTLGQVTAAFNLLAQAYNIISTPDRAATAINAFISSFAQGNTVLYENGRRLRTVGEGAAFLRDRLKELGDEGDRLWQALQRARTPNQAQAAIDAVRAALANTPLGLTEAAGFQTRAQLQEVADKARTVYEFMRDSGRYTAEQVADAFARSRTAQIAALDDVSRAALASDQRRVDSLTNTIKELSAEYDRLFASVANEAPEEVMGIIEQQQRARMAAIDVERSAAQAALEEANANIAASFDALGPAAGVAASAIVASFDGVEIVIPVRFAVEDLSFDSQGRRIRGAPALALGSAPAPALALNGERSPRTVSPSQFSSEPGTSTVIIEAEGRSLAEIVVPFIPGVVQRYGLA